MPERKREIERERHGERGGGWRERERGMKNRSGGVSKSEMRVEERRLKERRGMKNGMVG